MDVELKLSDGRVIPVPATGAIIGKDPKADVRFPSATGVEARHAQLQRVGNQWFLEALTSTPFRSEGRVTRTLRMKPGLKVILNDNGDGFTFQLRDPVRKDSQQQSHSEPTDVPPLRAAHWQMYAVGGILAFVLTITVIILLMNRSNPSEQNDVIASREHSSEVPAPLADIDSTSTVAAPTTASVQIIRDPRDFLVLFGYRNPAEDIPPIVITVGWLADSHTIVVPAEIVRGLEGALAEAEQQGTALKLCALPGAPVDIASWSYPAKCPEVCLMRTQDPVSPVEDVVNQITKSGAARIGQLAERDGVISHCSYEFLPRSTGLNQPLVSLVSYTPGMSRQKLQATQVSLELSPQGTLGWIGEPVESDESPLERGGLIVDSENMILAMCLPTGELVWSDTLLKALPTSRQ